jgi:hypothetical protein
LTDNGYLITFDNKSVFATSHIQPQNSILIGIRIRSNLYYATQEIFTLPMLSDFTTSPASTALSDSEIYQLICNTPSNNDFSLDECWHNRLGHCGDTRLITLYNNNLASGFTVSSTIQTISRRFCESCVMAKLTRTPSTRTPGSSHSILNEKLNPHSLDETPNVNVPSLLRQNYIKLQKFVMDIKSVPFKSLSGKQYALIITCYVTRYRWIYFLSSKDDTLDSLKKFILKIRQLKISLG